MLGAVIDQAQNGPPRSQCLCFVCTLGGCFPNMRGMGKSCGVNIQQPFGVNRSVIRSVKHQIQNFICRLKKANGYSQAC